MSEEKKNKIFKIHMKPGTYSSSEPMALVGKPFKRNKYGLSLWEDIIKNVWVKWEVIDRETKKPKIVIRGFKSDNCFDLDEIVILREPIDFFEDAQLQKRSMFENLRIEDKNKKPDKE